VKKTPGTKFSSIPNLVLFELNFSLGSEQSKKHARNVRKIYKHIREIAKAKGKDGPKYKYGIWLPD
jgi:hypothetical protein